MKADKISLENAKPDKLFYFVANVVIFKEGRCLILKRSDREKVHPGKWAVLGGKLEWKDLDMTKPTRMNGDVFDFQNTVEDLLSREVEEEAGIKIQKKLMYINSVAFVRPDGIPVILVKFATKHKSGKVKIDHNDFTGYKWVDATEVKKYPCIKGIPGEIAATIKMFKIDK